ncbi:MAG: ACT domain-containing protein [Candidatus Micrarchaeota archaeon]|nr:ACT domain-containing protein [Candidatus Micrarchaeota archaeon]
MKQLTIVSDDKVGLLADISYILGKSRINIEAISVGVAGGKAIINLTIKDDARASQLLGASGYQVFASDVLVIKIPDTPGELARISKLLADEGINIENVHILAKGEGFVLDSIKVDKGAKASKLLAPYLNIES